MKISIQAGVLIAMFLTFGCKTRQSGSGLLADQGLPHIYPGHLEFASGGYKIFLTELDEKGKPVIDPSTGKPKPDRAVALMKTSGAKATFMSLDATPKKLGPDLDANPNATYSYFTNSPLWKCGDAEQLVGRTSPKRAEELKDSDDCYIEENTTGDLGGTGIAIAVIGLPKGVGLKKWVNDRKPVLKDGPKKPLDVDVPFLKPGEVNAGMDIDGVVEAMNDVKKVFNVNAGESMKERNTCLKNALAVAWPDSAAHYFCQFPLDQAISGMPWRRCYSEKLISQSRAGAANPHKDAYEACWKSTKFFTDATLGAKRFKSYAYLMWTKQGALDFNIEDENKAINKFYGVKQPDPEASGFDGDKRPRREADSFPNWLVDQPRYNKIREAQKAMQDKIAAAGAGGAAATPTPTPKAAAPEAGEDE